MTQRSAFQVQILEKLGAPLMTAVGEVAARQKEGETQKQEAERVAELLTKTVQVSVSLAGSMDVKDAGEQGDAIRLALAALASPLIAGQYRATGKVPGDNDLKRLVKALEAVLAFSDTFAPAASGAARLENLESGTAPFDESQANIQYIGALVPVVNIVAAFSFGRPEAKLLQEVADRLVSRAEAMAAGFMNGAEDGAAKQAAISLLRGLALVYVECHRQETDRLMALDDEARAKAAEQAGGMLPMDPVWQAFESRADMMEILGRNAAPQKNSAGAPMPVKDAKPPASAAPAPVAETPSPPPAQEAQPEKQAESAPEAEPEDASGVEGNYNPMGFFKAKPASSGKDEDGEGV